jgi:hypothetical protein
LIHIWILYLYIIYKDVIFIWTVITSDFLQYKWHRYSFIDRYIIIIIIMMMTYEFVWFWTTIEYRTTAVYIKLYYYTYFIDWWMYNFKYTDIRGRVRMMTIRYAPSLRIKRSTVSPIIINFYGRYRYWQDRRGSYVV